MYEFLIYGSLLVVFLLYLWFINTRSPEELSILADGVVGETDDAPDYVAAPTSAQPLSNGRIHWHSNDT